VSPDKTPWIDVIIVVVVLSAVIGIVAGVALFIFRRRRNASAGGRIANPSISYTSLAVDDETDQQQQH
jgi:hypothetical protein